MYREGAESTGGGLDHLSPVGISAPATHQQGTDAEPVAEAEILYPKLFHKRGAVAAARVGNDINPERRSDGLQFYIVMGQFYLEGELREFESEERPMPEEVKKAYMTEGGTPHLDGEYTVFGQIVSGMRTIEKICASETDETDKPRKEIYIKSAKVVSRP